MKKHGLPLLAILSLASCIEVKDFGTYWDKAIADPALDGTWKKIGLPGAPIDDIPGSDRMIFTREGISYSLQMTNPIDASVPEDIAAQARKDNEFRIPVRVLKVGPYKFMMIKGGPGPDTFERYEIKGNVLSQYTVDADLVLEDIARKHPTAKNIGKNTDEGTYLVVQTFDDEVYQILSEIPATSRYWSVICQYKRSK